jgi:hypothetical protein
MALLKLTFRQNVRAIFPLRLFVISHSRPPSLVPPDPNLVPSTSRTSRHRQADPPAQSAPLSTIAEEPMQPGTTHSKLFHCFICAAFDLLWISDPPIPDSPSNPFLATNTETNRGRDNANDFVNQPPPPASPGAESFPDASSASSRPGTPSQRPRGTPQVGRHSTVNRPRSAVTSNTRATHTKKKAARDVWTFFQETDGGRVCVFCQYVVFLNASRVLMN